MAFTGKLGTVDSIPGASLVLGFGAGGGGAPGDPFDQLVEQSLSFSQDATFTVVRHVEVAQSLVFSDDPDSNIHPESVSDTIAFVQTATGNGPVYVTVHQTLHLEQAEDTRHAEANIAVAQSLVFSQAAGRVITQSVAQTIAFSQEGERRHAVNDTLTFVQTALAGKGGDVDQELTFTQVVVGNLVLQRTISDTLNLQQSVTFYIERGCTARQYTPFVGAPVAGYTPPETTAPVLSRTQLTLTYPFVSPTLTLVLRNPEFGDRDRLNFNRINRMTRGGTLIVYADPKWPKTQTLVLQVDALSQQQAQDFKAFLIASLGKEIGLLDWEGRQWKGIIVTPDARITHVGKHDRSIAFEFQGTIQ